MFEGHTHTGGVMLSGGSNIEEAAAAGARREPETAFYTDVESGRRRRPVTRHQVLLALCSAAVAVCAVGGIMRSRGEDISSSELSSKLLFGAGVGGDDIADSILNDARKKYEASKQRLAAKHSALVAPAEKPVAKKLVTPVPAAKSASKVAQHENALTLEEKIAQHKITTRDLVKEVEEKQQEQAQAMAGQLQDQTDDLIVASIKAMKKKSAGHSTTSYVLDNALTKTEKQSLAHGGAIPEVAHVAPSPVPSHVSAAQAAIQAAPEAANQAAPEAKEQAGVHPQLMETPHGMSLNSKKAPNTSGMLSSYDQQILKMGPDGSDSDSDTDSAAPSPPPSPPQPAAYQQPAPQYAQPQYQAPPYQQLAGGMPAPQYPQQQMYQPAAPYGGYAPPQQMSPYEGYAPQQGYQEPQYAYQPPEGYNTMPANGQYGAPVAYEQQPYRPYPGQQLYAAPAPYGYAQPQYAQPYQQPYAYSQPQYPQYQQQPQYAQQPMASAPLARAAPAAPPPTPAQLLTKAKQLEAQIKGGAATQQQPASHAQALAAYTTAGPVGSGGGGGGGGGLLWRMFTAPSSAPAPAAVPSDNGVYQQPAMAQVPAPAPSLAQNMGADSMASIDPQNLGVGSQKDAVASLSMSASAKQSIKAKMMALRQGILNDFKKTTDMGAQAGYLPPPPMP